MIPYHRISLELPGRPWRHTNWSMVPREPGIRCLWTLTDIPTTWSPRGKSSVLARQPGRVVCTVKSWRALPRSFKMESAPVVGIYLAENDLQTLSIWTISKCTESKQPNIIDLGIACQTNGRFRKQLKSKVSFIVYACLRLKTSRWAILFLPDLFTNIATKLVLSVSSNLSRDQWNILCLKCTYWPTITWARWPN